MSVHSELGPGLLESIYEACLIDEFVRRGIRFERQKYVPVYYRGSRVDCDFRIDLLIEDCVILELKTIERFDAVHTAQMLTYLKITGCHVGLLINFNVIRLKDGIRRVVLGYDEPNL
jgi:GxxExxY protein